VHALGQLARGGLHRADAIDDLGHRARPVLGLVLGPFSRLRRLRGVFRHLEHRGVHFLHGGGRFRKAVGLLFGTLGGLLDLGGELLRSGGDDGHHRGQAFGRLEHAFGPGIFGGRPGGFGGLGGLPGLLDGFLGFDGLFFRFGDLQLEVGHHLLENGKDAALAGMLLEADIHLAGGDAAGHLEEVAGVLAKLAAHAPDDEAAHEHAEQGGDHEHTEGDRPALVVEPIAVLGRIGAALLVDGDEFFQQGGRIIEMLARGAFHHTLGGVVFIAGGQGQNLLLDLKIGSHLRLEGIIYLPLVGRTD